MRRPYENPRLDVSIVLPAHNEEGNIGPLMDQFAELARNCRFHFEVVLVDDGSTDQTMARALEAQRAHRFVRVVSFPFRRGLTEALRAGFAAAKGGIIVFYPADRQFHPNDIPRMVDKLREGYDLVTGRKIGEYDKKVVSGVYNRLSRLLFPSIPVTDLNSVKAFRRELTEVFDYRHDWHRFWVAIVSEAGYRVGEVDVTLYKRRAGKSKFGFWRIPGGVLDLLAVKFQYHTMRRPLWYFGMTGSFLLAAAFVLGVYAIYDLQVHNHGYRPLLFLIMTLGISGIVFFTLGFLAESVAGIREQLKSLGSSPRYNVRQVSSQEQTSGRTPVQPAPEPRSERSSGSTRPSSDTRRRRGNSDDRHSRPSNRRTPRNERAGDQSTGTNADAPAIRRRALDPKPEESPVPETETAATPHQRDRDVSENDLFTDTGSAQPERSSGDSGSEPSSAKPEPEEQPRTSAPPSPVRRPFGRRNRR